MLFLIEYDRNRGAVVRIQPFVESEYVAANRARLDLELDLSRRGISREVVFLDAASEDDLRRTHRRYFEGIVELTGAIDDGVRDD